MVAQPTLLHRSTYGMQFFCAAQAVEAIGHRMNHPHRQIRAVLPNRANQILLGIDAHIFLRQRQAQTLVLGYRQSASIHADHRVLWQVFRQPCHMGGVFFLGEFLQHKARACQFFFSLYPIAAIHPQASKILGNHQSAH